MELILNLLKEDHKKFRSVLNEIKEHTKNFNKEPETPKERFNVIKNMVFTLHKFTILTYAFKRHVELRDLLLSTFLLKSEFKEETDKLEVCQENITVLLRSVKDDFLKLKKRKPNSIGKIASTTLRKCTKICNVFEEFIVCEERIFKKIKIEQ